VLRWYTNYVILAGQRKVLQMAITRRIFVSMPADNWLSRQQNDLKWGVVERIERLKYVPEIFTDSSGRKSRSAGKAWSANDADEIMKGCCGAVIIGLPRWNLGTADGAVHLPTEYSHYEGAVARTFDLPLLILAQDNLMRRVVFDPNFGPYMGKFPEKAGKQWLNGKEFKVAFGHWREAMGNRRDFFLGYCGAATKTAKQLRDFLEKQLGATVLDWQRDFKYSRSIIEEIEEARVRCSAGIFLFTKDDLMSKPDSGRQAAPRDNVVFEAGYFCAAKDKKRVLIIRELGAKMPADLGGDIYVPLDDRRNLTAVKKSLRKFVSGF
jgi:CAP12/Pycsar effector protein, TIR domain